MQVNRLLALVVLLYCHLGLESVFAQTYTSNSNGNWTTPGTWTITNTTGCGSTIPTTPPVGTNNRPCPIVVIINHNISRAGNLTLGNNNTVSIQIAANRTLSLGGNLSVTAYNNKNLSLSGAGTLDMGGNFGIEGNNVATISGSLAVDIGGTFNLTEASQVTANGTLEITADDATIDGNGSLSFQALGQTILETTNGSVIFRDGSNILFSGNSGVISDSDVTIDGHSPAVRFEGNSFLEASRDVNVLDGSTFILEDDSRLTSGRDMVVENQAAVEVYDNAEVDIDRHLEILDDVEFSASDNTELTVGENLILEGQSDMILSGSAAVGIGGDVELSDGVLIQASDSSGLAIVGELTLDGIATVSMNEDSSIEVEDETTVTTNNLANGIRFNDSSSGAFNSDLLLDGNSSTLFTSGNPLVEFNGSVIFEGGADIFITGDSELAFSSTLLIRQSGTTFSVSETSQIEFTGAVSLQSSADVTLSNTANLTFLGNLTFDNNNSTTWINNQSATVSIVDVGNFSKGANSYLTVNNSGVFEICPGTFPLQSSDPRIVTGPSPAYYGGCRILPVEYLSFSSEFDSFDRTAWLSWTTAKEWENSHFELERTLPGSLNWDKIGQMTATGYSDRPVSYFFKDPEMPASGGTLLYRLKQVDFNGNFTYSPAVSLQVDPIKSKTAWIAYPNPSVTGSNVTLAFLEKSAHTDGKIQIILSDIRGISRSFFVSKPEEVTAAVNSVLENSRPGLYLLYIVWGTESQHIKLIRK